MSSDKSIQSTWSKVKVNKNDNDIGYIYLVSPFSFILESL